MARIAACISLTALTIGSPALADWNAYDEKNETYLTVEGSDPISVGDSIEIYDWSDGSYERVDVINIDQLASPARVMVVDPLTGALRTFEAEP